MATELESDLHPNTASLAILTAILDRKGVMESDGSDKQGADV